MSSSSYREIVSTVRISLVYHALGGGPLRMGRGQAFWRSGDGFNVSLDDHRGVWFDFRDGIGGGVLDLVQHIRKCSRTDALRWLADFAGVPLRDAPLTPSERQEYARQRTSAEREAGALIAWRDHLVRSLEATRSAYLQAYHRAVRVILKHGLDTPEGRLAADVADCYEPRYQQVDCKLDLIRKATFAQLLPYFRGRLRKPA